MKIYYDEEMDALYLELSSETPDGVVEVNDSIHIDTTKDNRITGIEILSASKNIDISTIMSYSLNLEKRLSA